MNAPPHCSMAWIPFEAPPPPCYPFPIEDARFPIPIPSRQVAAKPAPSTELNSVPYQRGHTFARIMQPSCRACPYMELAWPCAPWIQDGALGSCWSTYSTEYLTPGSRLPFIAHPNLDKLRLGPMSYHILVKTANTQKALLCFKSKPISFLCLLFTTTT
jgi:hypothetical protein